ncbi:M28 family peptidase [Lewinella sp. IMCC34183]|uniref:M28 family peptidase n=1 Tax=Lewinella sp. IMCC34183 TaxID=2248762 RepID=UPI000E25D8D3|nr:M28 family peptidase [Lewinella sp. IMCC34183]
MTRLLFTGALFLTLAVSAQDRSPLPTTDEEAREIAATIVTDDLRRHLTVLSADDMEGRETGEPGQKRAAAYLAGQLAELGYPAIGENGGYFQTIKFSRQKWNTIGMKLNGRDLRHLWEFYSAPSRNTDRDSVAIDAITFLGYGIDDPAYSDYAGRDLRGKTIMIFSGEPKGRDGNFLVSGSKDPSEYSLDTGSKLRIARDHGVETVLVIDPSFRKNVQDVRRETLDGRLRMTDFTEAERQEANSVFITSDLAREILGKDYRKVVKARKRLERTGRFRAVEVPTDLRIYQDKESRELIGENVLGFLEGSDPDLSDEVVVVSAHYDHIGKRGDAIFNGADDNGSGSSTVLELAEAFALAKQEGRGPRRSVLFLWVSGEEKGLLGSEYYSTHPVFPLENTVADINVDMVGRIDDAHAGNPNYIYVIGSNRLSTELHDINEAVNRDFTQLDLDYKYNAKDDPNNFYERSDHYNFAEKGIPSIFFFNGTHADYHRDTDTIEKINFEKMARIGQLIFYNAWQLANQDKRIEVDVK